MNICRSFVAEESNISCNKSPSWLILLIAFDPKLLAMYVKSIECEHYVTVDTNPLHVAKNIFASGGTILRDDKDFNKCLRLHSRQSLSVDELFCLIQLKS